MTITLDGPWAKLTREDGRVTAALPLVDHCLDVGAAADVVFTAWRDPLEAAAGRALSEQDVARFCALAALHDIGKANRGFQAKIDAGDKLKVGHTGPVAALLNHSGLKRGAAAQALNAVIAYWGAHDHFAAVMAHHGRPLDEFRVAGRMEATPWTGHVRYWMPERSGDPTLHALHVLDVVRARWPLAWEAGAPLPDAPRLVALFAGLDARRLARLRHEAFAGRGTARRGTRAVANGPGTRGGRGARVPAARHAGVRFRADIRG
ncbi:CRISPR-associated endonuclease Cas3'' [Sphingomonas sp. HHU CXW]|uniref:CRISPR-associated endonuclease Cas3 n=1 Tax=Sphingomonas hominis TaxID=2741495 RepID=A0ABX2JI81_9SPHN|nr:CRISPR-associated endonuclease Cas3'' [Sphingomonas hominis]NTS65175.1 CRISPR-associated endonuclease Cas3'' [Sphingomonas hominis]